MKLFRAFLSFLLVILLIISLWAPALASESEIESDVLLVSEEEATSVLADDNTEGMDSVSVVSTIESGSEELKALSEDSEADDLEEESNDFDSPANEEAEPVSESLSEEEFVENPDISDNDAASEDMPADEFVYPDWEEPGNDTGELLMGGSSVSEEDILYYSDEGVYRMESSHESVLLSSLREAGSLNIRGEWLYFTADESIYRVPLAGGVTECLYTADEFIDLFFLCGDAWYYSCGNQVFVRNCETEEILEYSAPENLYGFLPTEYGLIYITGEPFARNIWCGEDLVYSGVENAYTDSGYLIVSQSGTYMISLRDLFEDETELQPYSLHGEEQPEEDGTTAEQQLLQESAYNNSDSYLKNEGQEWSEYVEDGVYSDGAYFVSTAIEKNTDSDILNIVKRARQFSEIEWTPLYDRVCWGGSSQGYQPTSTSGHTTTGYFAAGYTYKGIPYSQAVYTGYVGWSLDIDDFIDSVNNADSNFYSGYSWYSRQAPYYGSDCSGFVSWAWDLNYRQTCTSLAYSAFSDYIGTSISSIKLGDCLNKTSAHVVLVTNIGYDSEGNITALEITEETPPKMKVTVWAAGSGAISAFGWDSDSNVRYGGTLNAFKSYYLNNGYVIYRRSVSYGVDYNYSDNVYVKEDNICARPSAKISLLEDNSAFQVALSTSISGATIYYTLDSSDPNTSSTRKTYSEPFILDESCTLKACVQTSSKPQGFVLSKEIDATPVSVPELTLMSDDVYYFVVDNDNPNKRTCYVASGLRFKLFSDSGSYVYYTTDGSEPGLNSKKTSSKITGASDYDFAIQSACTIKAFAVQDGKIHSEVCEYNFVISDDNYYVVSPASAGEQENFTLYSGENGWRTIKNGTVFIEAIPDDGYFIDEFYVDDQPVKAESTGDDGLCYTFSNLTENHTVWATAKVKLPFTDVKRTSWAYDNLAFVYTNGLFSGTSATTFSPTTSMTRGMFITVLGRFAGLQDSLENYKKTNVAIVAADEINIYSSTEATEVTTYYADENGHQTPVTTVEYPILLGDVAKGSVLKITDTVMVDDNLWYVVSEAATMTLEGQQSVKEVNGYIPQYDLVTGQETLAVYSDAYTDIKGSSASYYTGYAQWAVLNNIVQGTSSTTVSPGKSITRQDICVMLYRYVTEYLGVSLPTSSGKSFEDSSKISSYAKQAVESLTAIGVINGASSGSKLYFNPKNNATRQEVAAMFNRLSDYLESLN